MPLFERCWSKLGLTDDDLRAAELMVMVEPDRHPVIQKTGGVRKFRFTGAHWPQGKRGAARVYYLYVPDKGIVIWLWCHRKNEEDGLTEKGKEQMRALIEETLRCFE
ncbi:MAG: hypothetical protein KDA22_09375 [Phycisphaerales bacterium]|nr:hypothetical protein [Phycisphaerales bacterium]